MNDLERIKGVEKEVAKKIERAKRAADASIIEMKTKEKQMIQKEVEKAKVKIEKKIKETEIKAKRDAQKIITDGKKQVVKIQNLASERWDNAIELIMNELIGD